MLPHIVLGKCRRICCTRQYLRPKPSRTLCRLCWLNSNLWRAGALCGWHQGLACRARGLPGGRAVQGGAGSCSGGGCGKAHDLSTRVCGTCCCGVRSLVECSVLHETCPNWLPEGSTILGLGSNRSQRARKSTLVFMERTVATQNQELKQSRIAMFISAQSQWGLRPIVASASSDQAVYTSLLTRKSKEGTYTPQILRPCIQHRECLLCGSTSAATRVSSGHRRNGALDRLLRVWQGFQTAVHVLQQAGMLAAVVAFTWCLQKG